MILCKFFQMLFYLEKIRSKTSQSYRTKNDRHENDECLQPCIANGFEADHVTVSANWLTFEPIKIQYNDPGMEASEYMRRRHNVSSDQRVFATEISVDSSGVLKVLVKNISELPRSPVG